jgi:hypothetical protein
MYPSTRVVMVLMGLTGRRRLRRILPRGICSRLFFWMFFFLGICAFHLMFLYSKMPWICALFVAKPIDDDESSSLRTRGRLAGLPSRSRNECTCSLQMSSLQRYVRLVRNDRPEEDSQDFPLRLIFMEWGVYDHPGLRIGPIQINRFDEKTHMSDLGVSV